MSQKSDVRFFRHYKNKPYKYIGVVRHSETLEEMALYESLYENALGRMWVRPKEMFFENVVIEGVTRPRFEKITFEFKSSHSLTETECLQHAEIYEKCFSKPLKKEHFDAKLKAHKNFLFLNVFDKEKLVGFKFGYAQDKDLFYSWTGGVLPEYRQLGLAGELMKKQHEWCVKNEFKKIETRTRNNFTDMIRLNFSFGFKIIGTQNSHKDDIKVILEKVL